MKDHICILEFPSNLGLKEPFAGHEPGVKKLPDFLRTHHFHSSLKASSVIKLAPPGYSMDLDEISGVRNAGEIIKYAKEQSVILQKVLSENKFPMIIGGDCSILIGNSLALKEMGEFALFFLDGHTDFMWPSLSQTGGASGMDLAIVTGYGHDKLTNINGQKPYFEEQNVWCVGNRDYEEWYVKAIEDSDINYTDLKLLRKIGIEQTISDFLQMIKDRNLKGFWIHIDVDVLNDQIMPAVDSRQPNGLEYHQFNKILNLLLSDHHARGLEITILDPELDPTGIYTKNFVANFCSTVNSTPISNIGI
ncbi:arginase [Pedobacter westerhofensis]|uniref:Arginase n=1 Tax=Pedobacter westerhofensis TaxID=425512 RepID=A0A521D2T5_9SPHI|nr:arginase family protein [Pedobacter westerhofensis]SMO65984.1 arginase [Pedobacter westerhofensis]